MDKYEYKLKMDEMKSLTAGGQYEDAAVIADTINWHKIKNVNDLMKAGEIYEKIGRYEEAREILLMAYDRSPIGRMIIYRLAGVAVEMGNFEEAEDYYQEFVGLAPHDNLKYVLKYRISKAKGANINTLIKILEELKEQEYSEEWSYELITLYHKAGMEEKCVDACDELVLWFGDGPYVERALEIKMLYQPLSGPQEEKYRRFRQKKEGIVEVRPDDNLESGEKVNGTMRIPKVKLTPERFNTMNLQEELQKGIQQIMEATEKEKVQEAVDLIQRAVEEVPRMTITKEFKLSKPAETSAEEVYAQTHPSYTDEELYAISHPAYMGMLAEEYDGQMSLLLPESAVKEPQVEGQMNISDLIEDWERAQEEARRRNLESARTWGKQMVEGMIDQLSEIVPVLDSGITPQEFFRQYSDGDTIADEEAAVVVASMNQMLQQEIEKITQENAQMDEKLAAVTGGGRQSDAWLNDKEPEEAAGFEGPLEEAAGFEGPLEEAAGFKEPDGNGTEEIPKTVDLAKAIEAEAMAETATPEDMEQIADAETKDVDIPEDIEKRLVEKLYQEELKQEDDASPKADRFTPITAFSEELRKIFTYFASIKGMEQQLCRVLSRTAEQLLNRKTAAAGNLMIQGEAGSGKTVLAKAMAKALQKTIGQPSGKVGTIEAAKLNKGDAAGLIQLVKGGCLIIEKAGDISKDMAERLASLLLKEESGLFVIIEDTRPGLSKALRQSSKFAACFGEKLQIPVFTNDELVTFARAYSNELGYMIDEMGVLALYNSISSIQSLDHATTVTEVKEIVDSAISHVEKGKIKKIFSIITSKRYDEEDYIILHEKDFSA